MDTITSAELDIIIGEIPDVLRVIISKDEQEYNNNSKLFQFALSDDIQDDLPDVLVYMADYDSESKTVKSFMGSNFDENGIFRKNLFPVYPAIYRKNKEDLFLVID